MEWALLGVVLVVVVQMWRIVQIERKLTNANLDFAYTKGKMENFIASPVLRQYIERNVPVLMTPEQHDEVKKRMVEREREWHRSQNEESPQPERPVYPDRSEAFPLPNTEDLV